MIGKIMKRGWIKIGCVILLMALLFMVFVNNNTKPLNKLSPMEIVNLYSKARIDGDVALLQKIMYFPPKMAEAEKNAKIESALAGTDEKVVMQMVRVGVKSKPKYQKFLDEDTAEVGVVVISGICGIGKQIPVAQVMLKQENGIWKYYYNRCELTREHLIEILKKDRSAVWAWYYLGMHTQPENPYKANKYFKKYCELDPKGFFVTDEFLQRIDKLGNTEKAEQEQLRIIQGESFDAGKVSHYIRLCQLFVDNNDFRKAQMYLQEAEDVFKKQSNVSPLDKQDFEKAKEELQLRLEGKYHDILDESEKSSQ